MGDRTAERVEEVLESLRRSASVKFREEMGPRYGIVVTKAMGVPMGEMQSLAKRLRPDHALALALWDSGWYEARTVASLIEDPAQVTAEQMDRWRSDFDNWAIVDTVCFKLFDQVPFAAAKVEEWAPVEEEFGRRAAFVLLACMALHGKGDGEFFLRGLALIEAYSGDERNFVKKAVNWALRAIGRRPESSVRRTAREVAERLAASGDKTARWIGRDALRAIDRAVKG